MIDEASLIATIAWRVKQMQQHVDLAKLALTQGDYSLAATHCHRAHQMLLVVDALEFALNETPDE